MNKKTFLIIGHARHGKDTAAGIIEKLYGLSFESSSVAAARIFLFDRLKQKYGYHDFLECYNDRVKRRAEWHDLICEYNRTDKARLAKQILRSSAMYVGMRSDAEINECRRQKLFDYVIGIYDPRKELEPRSSFDIDLWKQSDIVIPNAGDKLDLVDKIETLHQIFK